MRPFLRTQLQHKSRSDSTCPLIRTSTLCIVTGHDLDDWGSSLGKCMTFPFSNTSTSALGPNATKAWSSSHTSIYCWGQECKEFYHRLQHVTSWLRAWTYTFWNFQCRNYYNVNSILVCLLCSDFVPTSEVMQSRRTWLVGGYVQRNRKDRRGNGRMNIAMHLVQFIFSGLRTLGLHCPIWCLYESSVSSVSCGIEFLKYAKVPTWQETWLPLS